MDVGADPQDGWDMADNLFSGGIDEGSALHAINTAQNSYRMQGLKDSKNAGSVFHVYVRGINIPHEQCQALL